MIMLASVTSGLLALVSFGAALIWYDKFKKSENLRAEDRADAVAYAAELREAIQARDEMLAHWCNETIQVRRQLQDAWADKRRWEKAYAAKLPRSYN